MNERFEHPGETRRTWDPLVKISHWGIAAAVAANALLTEEGSGWHIWVGYVLATLLGLRLLWGVVGPAEARFAAFPPSPRRALEHLAEIRHKEVHPHRSHNPLGALMVYAMWATMMTIAATGIAMAGAPPADPSSVRGEHAEHRDMARASGGSDEAHDEEDDEGEEWIKEIHEIAVNLLYVLIALHIVGVVFETRRSGKELVLAMLPDFTHSRK